MRNIRMITARMDSALFLPELLLEFNELAKAIDSFSADSFSFNSAIASSLFFSLIAPSSHNFLTTKNLNKLNFSKIVYFPNQ